MASTIASTLMGAAGRLVKLIFDQIQKRATRPQLKIVDTRGLASDRGDNIHTGTYQVRIRNTGGRTAEHCKPRVMIRGTREWSNKPTAMENEDSMYDFDSEITVDAPLRWSESPDSAKIALHPEDTAWIDVLRMVEDYSAGPNFDPDHDRWLEFPSASGWGEDDNIRLRHADRETPVADNNMSRKAVHQTHWRDASLRVTSGENSVNEPLDFDDISQKIDASFAFPTTEEQTRS